MLKSDINYRNIISPAGQQAGSWAGVLSQDTCSLIPKRAGWLLKVFEYIEEKFAF
jgi:hypothetical protein